MIKAKVDTLIYCLDAKAEQLFQSFEMWETNAGNYETVKDCFRTYFVGKRNIIFETAQFNIRVQLPGERIMDFVASLHMMARHLEFGTLRTGLFTINW